VSASEKFGQLVALVAPVLQREGFSKRGTTFLAKHEENWKVIHFQKSRNSTSDEVIFGVNFGICSARLLDFFTSSRDAVRPPQVAECHWRQRLGAVPPDGGDRWWSIRSTTQTAKIGEEILGQLRTVALPEMERLVRDEALRDLWLKGQSPALTELQRLQNLAVLLSLLGPAEALPRVMEDLRRLSTGAARVIEQRLGSVGEPPSTEPSELIGIWISDSDDVEGTREFGRATLDFQSDGRLTYTTHLPGKDQKMFLTFRVDRGVLVTNQPSAPREDRTAYSFTADGKLVLWFGGQRSIYVRERE